ncbi:hypothetical protein [Vampirovibrio chlorellavorus]|uniref:hypothetical protein n=1 Tax=Vampirovibrio chlorellavorus TaxID=758823 RepID=UPI0026EFEE03|nr:hypothetical protein [Vampirovibrio chlorellavorus]
MTHVRFYEKNPTVKEAVTSLFGFSGDIRSILAKGMCSIAESDFNAHIRINDLKSLGKDKALALYKSRARRRDYDLDPYLSKAMNYLMILEPSDQFFLAVKVNDMIRVVREFMDLCQVYSQKIQLTIVERLTGTYVQGGLHEAQDLLSIIHGKFHKYFSGMKKTPPATPQPTSRATQAGFGDKTASPYATEAITDQDTGMRICLEN